VQHDRKEILLADGHGNRRYQAREIIGCEILVDDVQISYADRGSQIAGAAVGAALLGGIGAITGDRQSSRLLGGFGATIGGLSGARLVRSNVRKIVLRIAMDDFDKPYHDVVTLDWTHSRKGLDSDNSTAKEALRIAEKWHGRIVALIRRGSDPAEKIQHQAVHGLAPGQYP